MVDLSEHFLLPKPTDWSVISLWVHRLHKLLFIWIWVSFPVIQKGFHREFCLALILGDFHYHFLSKIWLKNIKPKCLEVPTWIFNMQNSRRTMIMHNFVRASMIPLRGVPNYKTKVKGCYGSLGLFFTKISRPFTKISRPFIK